MLRRMAAEDVDQLLTEITELRGRVLGLVARAKSRGTTPDERAEAEDLARRAVQDGVGLLALLTASWGRSLEHR